jgi:hypothetical protein
MSSTSTAFGPEDNTNSDAPIDCTLKEMPESQKAWDAAILNPASEPWFPTDAEIDWNSFNIPEAAFDPNLIFPPDFVEFPTYFPPVNYFPGPEVYYEPSVSAIAPHEPDSKRLESMIADLMHVKNELESKVLQLAR